MLAAARWRVGITRRNLTRALPTCYPGPVGEADRIRRLAARSLDADAIAAKLKLRPAVVRRVLGRSSKRGPQRKRGASQTLSFATSPEVAAQVRAVAAKRRVAVSAVLDEMVRASLRVGQGVVAPETAADAPEDVRKLLKSYEPSELLWRNADHRHLIVVAILTRGNEAAKAWLWQVLSVGEVRELVRQYGGAGCSEPDRVLLREQLGFTTTDIPARAFLGMER